MGPMNWLGVVAATLIATGVLLALRRRIAPLAAVVAMLVPAAMLGHALARIGAETLAAKPWLYFMQSGGLALAFVIPALWISRSGTGKSRADTVKDSGAFLLAYLAMGGVFFLLG